jgi:hypothetical protein
MDPHRFSIHHVLHARPVCTMMPTLLFMDPLLRLRDVIVTLIFLMDVDVVEMETLVFVDEVEEADSTIIVMFEGKDRIETFFSCF